MATAAAPVGRCTAMSLSRSRPVWMLTGADHGAKLQSGVVDEGGSTDFLNRDVQHGDAAHLEQGGRPRKVGAGVLLRFKVSHEPALPMVAA